MKRIKTLICLAMLGGLACANPLSANAQTTLDMRLYPGITITGAVGSVYSIQATTNAAQTSGWSTVGVIQLPKTNYVWFDPVFPTIPQRYYRSVAFTNVLTNMVFIPAGTFIMGSPTNELLRQASTDVPSTDESQHVVTLSKGFFMGKYLVTQTNYLSVVGGSNPSWFQPNMLTNPIESVTWFNATNYCALRTTQERATGSIPTNWAYRLPTESEWEYACRAGTSAAFYLGSGLHSGQANFTGTNEYDSAVGNISNTNGTYLLTTSLLENILRTDGGYMIWQAMCCSGVKTGMESIPPGALPIQPGQHQDLGVCVAVVVGSTPVRYADQLFVTMVLPTLVTMESGSGSFLFQPNDCSRIKN